MTLEPNTTVSHYKILSPIGKGGMGEVYLAQDTELDRKAAVKFLSEELNKDTDKVNRFVQEAKAASALNHPNILTVYEIGSWEDTRYIATEYIEGETLRDIIRRKDSMALNRILKIGIQVAEALSAAHEAGIAHRDIKPENIMVRRDGYVKVLDFGLAKLVEKEKVDGDISLEGETRALVKTNPGVVMGTANYMSPEQAQGKETDPRTDIWSLGVVLYEILTGRVPFEGKTVNHTIVSILETEPKLLENVPDELRRIVRKTLTKDRSMRYQNTGDLVIDLKNLRRDLDIQGELERSVVPNRYTESGPADETQSQHPVTVEAENASTQNLASTSSLEYAVTQAKSHKLATAVVAFVLLGVVSTVSYFGFLAGDSDQIKSIAVMPFVNESGNTDVEYLTDGMTETLISGLSQLPNLSVKGRSTVFRYKGKDVDTKTLGSELGVQAVLYGRVYQRGDQLTLSLELLDTSTENVIWSGKYDRKQADLVSLQSEIARDVSNKLKTRLSGAEIAKAEKGYTSNPEAYRMYLQGRFFWNKRGEENLKKSIEYFEQAITLDPSYGLAYAGLADAYGVMPNFAADQRPDEFYPKAREMAQKALEVDPSLAEPHATLGYILYEYDWNYAEAEKEFKRAIEIDPNYASAHQWYGEYLSVMRRFKESEAAVKRALELDPMSPLFNNVLGNLYSFAGRTDEAIAEYKKAIEIDPDFYKARGNLARAYFDKGMYEEGIEQNRKLFISRGVPRERVEKRIAELKEVYRKSGAKAYWQNVLDHEIENDRTGNRTTDPLSLAALHVRAGNKEEALETLEKAVTSGPRYTNLIRLNTGTVWAPLRSEPRFQALLRKMGLPS